MKTKVPTFKELIIKHLKEKEEMTSTELYKLIKFEKKSKSKQALAGIYMVLRSMINNKEIFYSDKKGPHGGHVYKL